MIDNLQIHFLEQLQLALTFALHGQVDTCVNICLELRLRPEVDLHTRAMINLTLADLLDIETHPDKIKFAQEALRLGRELLDEPRQPSNAYWAKSCMEIIAEAEEKISKIQAQQGDDNTLEDEVQHLSLGHPHSPEQLSVGRLVGQDTVHEVASDVFLINGGREPVPNTLPAVEGFFSLQLPTTKVGSETSGSSIPRDARTTSSNSDMSTGSEAGDTLPPLPMQSSLAIRETIYPTPAPSSRPGSEAPE